MAWSLIAHKIAVKTSTAAINSTGADLFIVAVTSYSTTPITVSDSASNTWTGLTERTSGNNHLRIFYCQGGTTSATHTFSTNANFYCIEVAVFSGSAATPFDVENGNTSGTTVSSLTTGSITPAGNGELIVSAFGLGADAATSACTLSVNSSLTITDQTTAVNGVNDGGALAYFAQPTAAAINPTWTLSVAQSVVTASIAAFKGAGGAATASAGILWRSFLDGMGGGGYFRGNRIQ